MFIPVPYRLLDGREFQPIPVVNALLIVVNVMVYCLGWHPVVGPGTGLFSVVTYAFGHAGAMHLIGNMLALLVFGTAVNRRLGNGWYFLVYFGSALAIGLFARLFLSSYLLGASGAIFAVIAVATLLLPSAVIEIGYFALFPMTLLIGLFSRPKHWVFWFIRWDSFSMRCVWGLFLVPLLEVMGLFLNGWNWTNLAHLAGVACGIAAVLLMPAQVTMRRSRRSAFASA
jgi:membrane associated rhomboid family serine protease